jgi:hypothetical protein
MRTSRIKKPLRRPTILLAGLIALIAATHPNSGADGCGPVILFLDWLHINRIGVVFTTDHFLP